MTREWPSREQWAHNRRTVFAGDEPDYRYYEPHQHLVTDAMKAAAQAELRAFWRALGPHVRGYHHDSRALDVRWLRKEVREHIDSDGYLDRFFEEYDRALAHLPDVRAAHPLPAVRILRDASLALRQAAEADFKRAVANRPIDDAAWAEELDRRARIDDYLTRPEARFERR